MSQPEPRAEGRDAYREVGLASRAAIERAISAGGLNRLSRVFLAVIYLTTCYSKRSDRVYVAQIAAVARIPGDVDERHTRRALKRLHELGVIHWQPARGREKQSWVSLLASDKTRPLLAPFPGGKTRPDLTRKPGQIELENPASSGPPTEKVREVARGLSLKTGRASCFVCELVVDDAVYYAGQWWCRPHFRDQAAA